MPERFLPYLFVLLWSSSFVAVKTGLRDMTPLLFVALRLTIAAAVLLAIMARRSWAPLSGRRWLHCGIAGILLNGIGLMPPHVGMEMAPAAHIALVQSLTPVLTALAGALWLSERLIPRQWAGLLLGVLGVGLVVGHARSEEHTSELQSH